MSHHSISNSAVKLFANSVFLLAKQEMNENKGEHMTFQELNIITPILNALTHEGYEVPSPIQEHAIPVLLNGRDILASAQTGTGKTAAFAIPIIQALYQQEQRAIQKRVIQALVLAPTRELADQIKESFRNYSRDLHIKTEVVYGGVSQKNQEIALKKGLDVLVATPGRLLDLINQGFVDLSHISYFVLDEADRMLDMGFIHDVKKIVKLIPSQRQTMLFSATIPKDILKLASELLKNEVRIEVTPPEAMVDKIKQSLFYVSKKEKTNLLIDLLVNPKLESVLVFTRTKHGANKLVKELLSFGVKADAIHGNKSQNKRIQALGEFKSKKLRVLVATDIAARGIDIDELSHVINYDLPESAETYVHRMGRTGRAGLSGEAFSFCSQDEKNLLAAIVKLIKMEIPVVENKLFSDKQKEVVNVKKDATKDVSKKIYSKDQPSKKFNQPKEEINWKKTKKKQSNNFQSYKNSNKSNKKA